MNGSADLAAIHRLLRDRRDEMASLLEQLVSMESPTSDPQSQQGAVAFVRDRLGGLGMSTRLVGGAEFGPALFGRRRRGRGGPKQLLLGHLDTVWPVGTLAEMPVRRTGDELSGPGTYDMKAGVVQLLFALAALAEQGVELPAEPVVFLNADEEAGSRESTRWIRMLACRSARAFVLEPSFGPDGRLKTARKGVGRFTLVVKGKAAHAGVDPGSGVSAVLEISHQIQRLFELGDEDRGITVNVGTVDGGLGPNVVAPEASAQIDVRALTEEDARRVEAEIRSLTPVQDGVTMEILGGFGRPPMEQTARNRALWDAASEIAAELGLTLDAAVVGGASDGNTASLYTATLDGLGGVGAGAHAAHEHVLVPAMADRAALLAGLLAHPLAQGDIP